MLFFWYTVLNIGPHYGSHLVCNAVKNARLGGLISILEFFNLHVYFEFFEGIRFSNCCKSNFFFAILVTLDIHILSLLQRFLWKLYMFIFPSDILNKLLNS